ncbi:conserved exported hypothetical protein [Vibrio chagasii]|jgi:hypothetical protein|uniref:hypothetical protein n=1 Tax=Vibrio TaxID=662 RepID=UPI000E32CF89|nr:MULTISPECIES: hypothetical protein [Vibrio]MCG9562585.1 hypothetical protein [Vibrio chagasii]MCG9565284.1 hypothetical protein [Vibrio chagasii]MCG9673997.1 hypothetical protein [Vibrio chagasii]NOI84129.1 hypothetical protein [Vibrio sp. 99K-1]CAH6832904.1 conserved exported hypothetical protein [Vibrio chagasii]
MMRFKTAALLTAALFSQAVSAQTEQPIPAEHLFNQASVGAVIDMAFDTKSQRYTEFATLFNLCQKLPDNPQCGEKYEKKRSNYELAKANYNVLLMANEAQFIDLMMPPSNYPELVSALKTLGYLSENETKAEHSLVLEALNEWLVLHSFAKTDEIYFMHALMVRAEELSQQLYIERHPI